MNLTKSKVVLKKINTFHDQILLSGQMSKIEKDLFLDYLREMYDLIIENNENINEISLQPLKHLDIIEDNTLEVKEEKIIDSKEEKLPKDDNPEESKLYPKMNGRAKEDPKSGVVEEVSVGDKKVNPGIESLFADESIESLSYRLSHTPISDVTKAMGINEKILIINRLFDKDQQEFNYVTAKLNYFNSFEEACNYLKTEVAVKYDWDSVAKRSKAIDFIRLVRRKYAL